MYKIKYCDYPENRDELKEAGYCFKQKDQLLEKKSLLDKYLDLPIINKIINSCSDDILTPPDNGKREYWEISKYTLNYLNAVYYYRCYLENFYNDKDKTIIKIDSVVKKLNLSNNFRFICEYRNRTIHQSLVARYYKSVSGEAFFNLDTLIRKQNNYINTIIKDINKSTKLRDEENISIEEQKKIDNIIAKKKASKENAQWFKNRLNEYAKESCEFDCRGKKLKSLSEIISNATLEINKINEELMLEIYDQKIAPAMNWILSNIYIENGEYKYTFFYNEDDDYDFYEPISILTEFYGILINELGQDHLVCNKIHDFFIKNHLDYFYDGDIRCSIDQFIDLQSKLSM